MSLFDKFEDSTSGGKYEYDAKRGRYTLPRTQRILIDLRRQSGNLQAFLDEITDDVHQQKVLLASILAKLHRLDNVENYGEWLSLINRWDAAQLLRMKAKMVDQAVRLQENKGDPSKVLVALKRTSEALSDVLVIKRAPDKPPDAGRRLQKEVEPPPPQDKSDLDKLVDGLD